jgi:hypothetical protein
MSASDVRTISELIIGPAGALVLAMMMILVLARFSWWLLKLVLAGKDSGVAYREQQVTTLQLQLDRQQDLFDQALNLLGSQRRGDSRG